MADEGSRRRRRACLNTVSAASLQKVNLKRMKAVNKATATTSNGDEWIRHEPWADNEEGEDDDVNVVEAKRKRYKCVDKCFDSWFLIRPLPGGPYDVSVLQSFGCHIARQIWDGYGRGVLNCHSRGEALEQLRGWKLVDGGALDLVTSSGLSHLIDCMLEHLDMPLLSAFVERWQPDTNTFHLPFGEMTIMLHDVFYILGLPVDGLSVDNKIRNPGGGQLGDVCELLHLNHVNDLLSSISDPKSMYIWKDGDVLLESILQKCSRHNVTSKHQAGGYLLYLLGSTLFVDNSGDRVSGGFAAIMKNADRICEYAWGAATLAYLYRQLGIATRADAFEICGCLTLFQAWIYEYFPIFRPARGTRQLQPFQSRAQLWNVCNTSEKDTNSLRHYRIQLDQLTSKQVTWLPYGQDPGVSVPPTTFTGLLQCRHIIEPYHPDRVLRQLGYIQVVPSHPFKPERAFRGREPCQYSLEFANHHTDSMWLNWRLHRLHLSDFEKATDPSTVSADYMSWYYRVSHPFLVDDCDGRLSYMWMSELVKRLQPALRWPRERRDDVVKDLFTSLDNVDEFVQLWQQAGNGPGAAPPSFPQSLLPH